MRFYCGTPGFGWRMFGFAETRKHPNWFIGLSVALDGSTDPHPVRPVEVAGWIEKHDVPAAGIGSPFNACMYREICRQKEADAGCLESLLREISRGELRRVAGCDTPDMGEIRRLIDAAAREKKVDTPQPDWEYRITVTVLGFMLVLMTAAFIAMYFGLKW